VVEPGPLPAELLGFFGIVPDVGVFQLPAYFLEAVTLRLVVKGTP
jgi:hypothetical protein